MKAITTFFLLPSACTIISYSTYSQSWPIHIEAENYTSMSGIQTETCGEGGLNVGYVTVGDWMDYSVAIPTAGIYGIRVRMAGPGGTIQIRNSSGVVLSWVSFPATVSGQTYTTAYEDIALPADGWQSYSPEDIRVIYYDEVRIGNENSNYSEVAPAHDTPASLLFTKR